MCKKNATNKLFNGVIEALQSTGAECGECMPEDVSENQVECYHLGCVLLAVLEGVKKAGFKLDDLYMLPELYEYVLRFRHLDSGDMDEFDMESESVRMDRELLWG